MGTVAVPGVLYGEADRRLKEQMEAWMMCLEKAAELLLTTNMTAAEVAYKVGFDDQYYFSKSFKRYFGQPPSQYRKGSEKSQEES